MQGLSSSFSHICLACCAAPSRCFKRGTYRDLTTFVPGDPDRLQTDVVCIGHAANGQQHTITTNGIHAVAMNQALFPICQSLLHTRAQAKCNALLLEYPLGALR